MLDIVAKRPWVGAAIEKMLYDGNATPGRGEVERETKAVALGVHVDVLPVMLRFSYIS